MRRYFFHVHDGQDSPDLQGTELWDLETAKREAVRLAVGLLADNPETLWGSGKWAIRVTGEDNLTLFQLTFVATEAHPSGKSQAANDDVV
ncbi:DUF6894 family protein [Sphingomonas sp. TZW2008]|uniref:DUF6894 family protein n=1 Tax=Sphingomonas sp. TZW2008 TaxID=1917973 RepID=UPI0011817918|nr:hypothetical protein [Sphingomonas sp. TZW2008]